ncbi:MULTISPECIES: aspartate ammonia-lyase [unclassified Rummeliibacillus]|uniref:aspartate ammonia-lyase n=1 Tax=unclassified Rummeliibacillus TaxID=2622809 RepID=UPI0018F724FE|nr:MULTISPECIES: aspartate ammonia-lyase [unclassified Rummeliibacillus]
MMVTTEFRIEKDFIGEKEIPKEAYYGVQTMRAIENFPITGYRIHPELIKSLGIVKKAAALSNMEVGMLDKNIGKYIIQACDEVIAGQWNEQFIVDPIQGGAGTSINMNTNEVIANRALELMGETKGNYKVISPNSHINMSQSTNDSFPTATHIAVLSLLNQLLEATKTMQSAFVSKSKEFAGIIKMGRTHLQDAVPVLLGQEFESYSRVVSRDIDRISLSRQHLYEVNMGATAVGTGLNADPTYIKSVVRNLSVLSGLPLKGAENLIDATQNTDCYTEVSANLKVCMINMSKIANDLRLMASGPRDGLFEIILPARQPGSSIMPGKVNPVMAEVVNQVAFQVIGNDLTISSASEAGQFELNVMEPVLFFNLIQSISTMTNVFKVFTEKCLVGIKANAEHLKEYVEKSVGIITAVNPHIGYELAAQIAKEAYATGASVRELCIKSGALTAEQLDKILDPYAMTTPGIAGGKSLVK